MDKLLKYVIIGIMAISFVYCVWSIWQLDRTVDNINQTIQEIDQVKEQIDQLKKELNWVSNVTTVVVCNK